MNILHTVSEYHPSVGGMQEVVRQISQHLVKLGHSVTVATRTLSTRKSEYINGVKIVGFDINGNAVTGYRGDVEAYRQFLLNTKFDIITNFAAQQWASDIMFPLLGKIQPKKVFVPTGFSELFSPKYHQYFQEMPHFLRQYDMCVFLSDEYRDIHFAREHNILQRLVIPNGAGEEEFLSEPSVDIRKKFNIPRDDLLILNVASHTGLKGHSEAIKIFGKASISNATFLIIGNEYWNGCGKICRMRQYLSGAFPRWKKAGKVLLVSSLMRDETVSAYKHADLFLFTSKIECSPIVLFECMASRTPFLTTDVGNATEIIKWSGSGIVLPTVVSDYGYSKAMINESASVLEGICSNISLRDAMSASGYRAWKEKFTWEKISRQYEKLYNQLLS